MKYVLVHIPFTGKKNDGGFLKIILFKEFEPAGMSWSP